MQDTTERKGEQIMIKSELSVQINASPEQVFARLSNPMNSVEDVPSIIEVKDIKGQGKGMTYVEVYKMAGVRLAINTTVSELIPNKQYTEQYEVMGKKGTRTCQVEPCDGGCRLSVILQYEVPIPLIGKLAEPLLKKLNERDFQTTLDTVKSRLEAQASAAGA
jgi:hypothetical protein